MRWTSQITILFAEQDRLLRPAAEVTQSSVACALVEAQAGIALLDRLSILYSPTSHALKFVPLRPEERIVGRLVLAAGAQPTAASREFCIELRHLVGEIAETVSGFGLVSA
ncbi:hypothetical protein IED13_17865 [Bosea sp. SSUT16]|uniref:Uncharacterized protein n=1 Tax=Bosea spartocytisi TaxID=2773451 RepID=A0A927HZG5_9HYPH|nr:hypothetical protein [Bosea spartocytisi]MBD3847570.1 hypothetical protein [Bosea spartocytisi]MCT4474380.1 hypothetical protein [Bosea spartocytisi]